MSNGSSDAAGVAVIAQGSLQRLREMQRTLKSGGIAAEILQPPEGVGNS